MAAVVLGMILLITLVNVGNAVEPTTLDDALNRPVKVQKYVDKDNNVVCYWADRYPQFLSCIQIRDWRHTGHAK
jgi:hypothetical protein